MSLRQKLLILTGIFVFSLLLRLYNLNAVGRTWDESAQFEDGYNFVRLILKGDFTNPYLYNHPDHPPVTKYLYGAASYLDIQSNIPNENPMLKGEPTFNYDITYSRLVSVFFSSLTVVIVTAFSFILSPLIGIFAGIILATLPFFLGLSQIASIESILIFFFTATVVSFLTLLQKRTFKFAILTGILLGFAIATKFTNIMLYPMLFIFYSLYYFLEDKKERFYDLKIFLILPVSLLTVFILWPMPWFHIDYFIEYNNKLRILSTAHSIPEVFYGRLMFVPKIYYFLMFLITTPLFLILSFFLGSKIISDFSMNKSRLNFLKKIDYKLPKTEKLIKNKKPWLLLSLIIWFLFPFLQSFYNFRQHGVRYIIQIYSPFSIIAAIGFVWVFSLLKTKFQKILLIALLIIYLFIPIISISPYYLDYFNFVVGGSGNVYEKRMFQLGWWGEGIKEAADVVKKTAKPGESVGLAVVPIESVPKMNNLLVEKYDKNRKYDFVIVSYFNVLREGFNDFEIKNNCKLIYSVVGNGARLVDDYKCH
ncbi:MAG: hypothetical protein A2152_01005 [Candidatus Levybacteria bacterium RBG_16_35_6]|nr:MAG: hypothetical protein A2152_01005 [Candidatus Levybacteria bacterium RBG_16_35_6]